jgi:hypothetical protein
VGGLALVRPDVARLETVLRENARALVHVLSPGAVGADARIDRLRHEIVLARGGQCFDPARNAS